MSVRVERWVLRIGAFALPLGFSGSTFDQFVLPKLLLAQLLVIALALLYILRTFVEPKVTWKRTPIDLPLLAFIASAALSTVFSVNRATALFGTYGRYEGLLTIATYGALFWLTTQALRSTRDATTLLRVMLGSGYVVALITVFQAVFGTPGTTGGFMLCLVRPYATMGNALPLAAFLAMLLPLAASEVFDLHSNITRIIAANVAIVLAIALLVTLTRGAWIGALVGLAIVVVGSRVLRYSTRTALTAGVISIAFIGALLPIVVRAADSSQDPCLARLASVADVQAGSAGIRLHVWADSIRLIESSPVVGYGPESFGLVYPRFQSGDWQPGDLFDKAHSDLLQIAATQGLVGVAVEVWLWLAFAAAFWSTRRRGLALGTLGGWVAYEIALQFGFSWVPSSLPFWILSAAAFRVWYAGQPAEIALPRPRPAVQIGVAGILVLGLGLIVIGLARSYAADIAFFDSLKDAGVGRHDTGLAAIRLARQLNPNQWVYAAQEGNISLDLSGNGVPRPRANWVMARGAFQESVRLGAFNPAIFRDLALVDYHLGDRQGAEAAARRAVELYRFDPANQAVLDFVSR